MDVFTDADLADQTHDYNPGTAENGLFWTGEAPEHELQVDVETGEAVFNLTDYPIPDFFTLGNALVGGGPEPVMATISVQCEWSAGDTIVSSRNREFQWESDLVVNTATLSWSTQNADGFSFTADPFTGGWAGVGIVRNGKFFT